jgi:hypothetical protein
MKPRVVSSSAMGDTATARANISFVRDDDGG